MDALLTSTADDTEAISSRISTLYTTTNASEELGLLEESTVCTGSAPVDVNPSLLQRVEVTAFVLMTYGLHTAVLLWVVVASVHILGVEPAVMPSPDILRSLVLNAVLDAAFNGFLLFGIVLSSPLFVSVGSMLVRTHSVAVNSHS